LLAVAAEDGTLMHVFAVGVGQSWPELAAVASLLHLKVRPTLGPTISSRNSAQGFQLLNELLSNPAVRPDIINEQTEWLAMQEADAVPILLAVKAEPAYVPWSNAQLTALLAASDLAVNASELIGNWQHFDQVLGNDGLVEVVGRVIRDEKERKPFIDGCNQPSLALAALGSIDAEPKVKRQADVWSWAKRLVKNASKEDWEAALQTDPPGALVDLALALVDGGKAPSEPRSLSDALYTHFQRLADGDRSSWQPDGSDFGGLTGLLSERARDVLASQLCANLEGRASVMDPSLLATYGDFLGDEQSFRSHPKLPNVVERFVANDDIDALTWVAGVAEREKETFRSTGRAREIENLIAKLDARIDDAGDSSSEVLLHVRDLVKAQQ
jgi:hypothetical protein